MMPEHMHIQLKNYKIPEMITILGVSRAFLKYFPVITLFGTLKYNI